MTRSSTQNLVAKGETVSAPSLKPSLPGHQPEAQAILFILLGLRIMHHERHQTLCTWIAQTTCGSSVKPFGHPWAEQNLGSGWCRPWKWAQNHLDREFEFCDRQWSNGGALGLWINLRQVYLRGKVTHLEEGQDRTQDSPHYHFYSMG